MASRSRCVKCGARAAAAAAGESHRLVVVDGSRRARVRVHRPVALVEVLRAERADLPVRPDEPRARRAAPLELRAAARAEDVVLVDALLAGGADRPPLGLAEQALLGELPLVRLVERLARPDD